MTDPTPTPQPPAGLDPRFVASVRGLIAADVPGLVDARIRSLLARAVRPPTEARPTPVGDELIVLGLVVGLVAAGVPDADIPARVKALFEVFSACEYEVCIGSRVPASTIPSREN